MTRRGWLAIAWFTIMMILAAYVNVTVANGGNEPARSMLVLIIPLAAASGYRLRERVGRR